MLGDEIAAESDTKRGSGTAGVAMTGAGIGTEVVDITRVVEPIATESISAC